MNIMFRPRPKNSRDARRRAEAIDRLGRSPKEAPPGTGRELCELWGAQNRIFRSCAIIAPLALAACSAGQAEQSDSRGVAPAMIAQADRILVDKSDRVMILYKRDKEIARYTDIKLGDAPVGHKQFEGDEKTPEGRYTINGRNPKSSYHLSLRISYPNAADRAFAKAKGRSPGGDIFIHGQPNASPLERLPHDWTDGCIALSNEEIKTVWKQVADGTSITIRP
jgi:L,D-transpeptidase catalytic domain